MANPSDKQMLRDANGDLIPQYWDVVAGNFKPLTGSDGAQDTRLTGSIVEHTLVDSLALRETGTRFINGPTSNDTFRRVYLYVRNTLDVELSFGIRPFPFSNNPTFVWDGSFKSVQFVTIPSSARGEYLINSAPEMEWINDLPVVHLKDFTVRLSPRDTPTEGSVSVILLGVK